MSLPPPVPPIADADRYQVYIITAATASVQLTFPLFGDASDIDVYLNGAIFNAWALSSASGQQIGLLPLPLTDGIITFNAPVTAGTIEIVGSWRPRQGTLATAPGIGRREYQQAMGQMLAGQRELFHATSTLLPLSPVQRASKFLAFDANGVGYAASAPQYAVTGDNASFPSITSAMAAAIDPSIGFLRVAGFVSPGDGGEGLYVPVATVPSNLSYFQSADGRYWQIVPNSESVDPLGRGLSLMNKTLQGLGTITVAFEGDSLTYGQDTSATGTRPPINGASQTRSSTSYPEAMQAALVLLFPGATINIVNRGFPGDSTTAGLNRWATASPVDCVFLCYGTNDANAYGGLPRVSPDQYRNNLRQLAYRRIAQGSVVVILAPPLVTDPIGDRAIEPFRNAALEVARELSLVYVDSSEQLAWMTGGYATDGVHLTAVAYNEWGWHLAALFAGADRDRRVAKPGIRIYAQDQAVLGGTVYLTSLVPAGTLLAVFPNQTVSIAVWVEQDCVPFLTTYNTTSGTSRDLVAYYAGGNSGVPILTATNDGSYAFRRTTALQPLARGLRIIQVRNNGSQAAYVEAVEFKNVAQAVVSSRGRFRKSGLGGLPLVLTDRPAGWFAWVDYGIQVSGTWSLVADMILPGTVLSGIALFNDRSQVGDFLSSNAILFLRSGSNFLIRYLIGGTISGADTVVPVAGLDSTNYDTLRIEVFTNTDGSLNLSINGSSTGTRAAPPFTSGFPGIISAAPCYASCLTFAARGD